MIERITYARLYALPNYENERFEAVAIVQDGDVDAAFDEARQQVEAQWMRFKAARHVAPTEPLDFSKAPPVPATSKQRNYIATLQDALCWTSEQLAVYAREQNIDLAAMTMRQASAFIDGMKRLNEGQPRAPQGNSMFKHLEPPSVPDDLPF